MVSILCWWVCLLGESGRNLISPCTAPKGWGSLQGEFAQSLLCNWLCFLVYYVLVTGKQTAKFTWNQLVCMHEFSSQKQQKTPANQLISGKFCSFTVVLVLLFQVYEYLILYIYSMLFVIILSCRAHILHVPQHNYWQVAMHVWILFVVCMEWEGWGECD